MDLQNRVRLVILTNDDVVSYYLKIQNFLISPETHTSTRFRQKHIVTNSAQALHVFKPDFVRFT